MQRREFLTGLSGAALAAPLCAQAPVRRKGGIKQSLTRGVFGAGSAMSFDEQCRAAASLGVQGFDLIPFEDWPTLKKYGLTPAMAPPEMAGVSVASGINQRENHPAIEIAMRQGIDRCSAAGCPNLITLSGNRRALSDEEGISACADLLNRVKAHAEQKGVTIALELLNSKVDHRGYQCDRTAWGVEVCRRVNSPRVKLLFDIYHMQIMEGDICHTIRENFQWIAHFHTAGVPGRHEIGADNELNYRFVAQTLADLHYPGYAAHEYRPVGDPLESCARPWISLMFNGCKLGEP